MAVHHVRDNESCGGLVDGAALASTAVPSHASATLVCLGINNHALCAVAAVTERRMVLRRGRQGSLDNNGCLSWVFYDESLGGRAVDGASASMAVPCMQVRNGVGGACLTVPWHRRPILARLCNDKSQRQGGQCCLCRRRRQVAAARDDGGGGDGARARLGQ
jgi:hypothetical protein